MRVTRSRRSFAPAGDLATAPAEAAATALSADPGKRPAPQNRPDIR